MRTALPYRVNARDRNPGPYEVIAAFNIADAAIAYARECFESRGHLGIAYRVTRREKVLWYSEQPDALPADKPVSMLALYLRREPTRDPLAPSYRGRKAFDVVCYDKIADVAAGKPKARWTWDSRKPRPSDKTFMLNCWRWRAMWLPDVVEVVSE